MADQVKTTTEAKLTRNQSSSGRKNYTVAVGRRRAAVARVRLYEALPADFVWGDKEIKKGEIFVNEMPIAEYFSGDTFRYLYSEPFRVTNTANVYTLTIRVTGGGKSGQLDAVVSGIAKVLALLDDEKRTSLKKKGFLTRDARIRERRKVGTGGKARRKKQSPKR